MFQELKRHVMYAPAADSVASALTFGIAFDSMATASGKLPKAGAPASESQQASENPGSKRRHAAFAESKARTFASGSRTAVEKVSIVEVGPGSMSAVFRRHRGLQGLLSELGRQEVADSVDLAGHSQYTYEPDATGHNPSYNSSAAPQPSQLHSFSPACSCARCSAKLHTEEALAPTAPCMKSHLRPRN